MKLPAARWVRWFAACAAGGLVAGSLHADLPTPDEIPSIYDDFSAGTLDTGLWAYRLDGANEGQNVAGAVTLGMDGTKSVLNITGNRATVNGYPFTCGGVITKIPLGYGYYEISALMPSQAGWHCSFWLAGENEIDAPEYDTGLTTTGHPALAFNTHFWPDPKDDTVVGHAGWGLDYNATTAALHPPSRGQTYLMDPSTAYHRYGFEWTPTQIFWYVDGVLQAQTRYPGPHAPTNVLKITMLAMNALSAGITAPVVMRVDYFKFYSRRYDFPDWQDAVGGGALKLNPSLPVGDVPASFAPSKLARDPDQLVDDATFPAVISTNDYARTVKWDFSPGNPSPVGRYEVFAWNPSVFPASYLSADISSGIEDGFGNPGGWVMDYTIGADVVRIDQAYGGQSWLDLGTRSFAGATSAAVTMEKSLYIPGSPPFPLLLNYGPPLPLWPLRAGPLVFRPLTCFDDFASGSFGTTWSQIGTWAESGGTASNSGTGETLLVRQDTNGVVDDGFVRALVQGPTGVNATAGVVVRYSSSGYYLFRLNYASGGKIGIVKKETVGGTAVYTTLADVTIPADISLASAQDLVLVVRNTTFPETGGTAAVDLVGFVKGRPIVAVTDRAPASYLTTAGPTGVRAFGGTTHFDNFGAGQ